MAFERFSISAARPASKAPVSKPPVTGGDLPPLSVNGTPDQPPTGTPGAKKGNNPYADLSMRQAIELAMQNQLSAARRNPGSLMGIMPIVLAAMQSKGRGAGNTTDGTKKPGGSKPPATPAPQWAFKPNPLDQPSYVVPMGNAAAYTINPPAQQWMFDPATYGQGAPPQWYGQPVVPNSQPPFRY